MCSIFLNFAKSCVLLCLSKIDNIKKNTVPFLNYKHPLGPKNDNNVFSNDFKSSFLISCRVPDTFSRLGVNNEFQRSIPTICTKVLL